MVCGEKCLTLSWQHNQSVAVFVFCCCFFSLFMVTSWQFMEVTLMFCGADILSCRLISPANIFICFSFINSGCRAFVSVTIDLMIRVFPWSESHCDVILFIIGLFVFVVISYCTYCTVTLCGFHINYFLWPNCQLSSTQALFRLWQSYTRNILKS